MMFIPESLLLRVERHAGILLALCVAGIVVACLYPFDFITVNHFSGDVEKGVEFSDPSIAHSRGAVTKLSGVERFTLSLRIMPRSRPFNRRIGQIIGSGLNDGQTNFALRQRRKDLCLTLGAGSGEVPGCRLLIRDIFPKPEYLWIDIVYDGAVLRSYVNGVARDSAVYAIPLRWDASYPLVAGNSTDLRHAWSGRLDTLALFPDALPANGRSGGWRGGAWGRPLVLYTGFDREAALIRDGGTGDPADLFVPNHVGPNRRAVLEPFNDFRLYDIVFNIVGFIPLGFLVSLLIRRSPRNPAIQLILVVSSGLTLSLAMEILQTYLPTRSPAMADVVSNSVGMIPGYVLCKVFYEHSS